MKRNLKITLCGIVAALSVVFMLLSYFPYLTYAVPAATGLLIMMIVIEIDTKWAFCTYLASAVIIFLIAEPESKLMYVCLFGYYPIVKALAEKIRKPILEWIIKLLVFNVAIIAVYLLLAGVFNISIEDLGALGKYGAYLLLIFGNAVFIVYDIAVSRMATVYFVRIHPKIGKFL